MATRSYADQDVRDVVQRVWGFDGLRPLQAEAIDAALAGRDAMVVLPTGGGKSLCYQTPPLVAEELSVVVSPLISLMKDQVDALALNGYPAAGVHSGCSREELDRAREMVSDGSLRLLFVSPERLANPRFSDWLGRLEIARFAIDEAHCISHWGHDFRPEYRRLATLRQRFPKASIQAFTATATPRVREDICAQLELREPKVLVGTFDRPNLVYRILPRLDLSEQIAEVLARHENEAAIVYCISRKDTEAVAADLRSRGVKADHYHAGLEAADRRRVQEAFSREELDVVVATVAFGMGIDRSNVRCVIHAAMPKSVEAYQQETGRAGRDGLEAECVMFQSSADAARWSRLFEKSASEAEVPPEPEVVEAQYELLGQMRSYCCGASCRHRTLSEHFGQAYEKPSCEACDVCLNELDAVEDSQTIAQQVLSCVARLRKHSGTDFGAAHLADVLRGSRAAKIVQRGHDTLSTHGLLREHPREAVLSYINQLVDLGVLARAGGEFPTISLNDASVAVLRGERAVTLMRPKEIALAASPAAESRLGPEETRLFEALRTLRREIAEERNVPPYIVFGDDSLCEMALARPGSRERFATIKGVGRQKLEAFGERFVACIRENARALGLDLDAMRGSGRSRRSAGGGGSRSAQKSLAFRRFAEGASVEAVAEETGRTPGTTSNYLAEWIEEAQPERIDRWIEPEVYRRIAEAARKDDSGYLRPIFEALGGEVPYEQIKPVVAHLKARVGA